MRTKYEYNPNRSSVKSYKQSLIPHSPSLHRTAPNSPEISHESIEPKKHPNSTPSAVRIQSLNKITPLDIPTEPKTTNITETNPSPAPIKSPKPENKLHENEQKPISAVSKQLEIPPLNSAKSTSNEIKTVHVERLPRVSNAKINPIEPVVTTPKSTPKVSRLSKPECHAAVLNQQSSAKRDSSSERFGHVRCTLVERPSK